MPSNSSLYTWSIFQVIKLFNSSPFFYLFAFISTFSILFSHPFLMFSLAHINVRSLLNNFATFQDHVVNYDYSIVGISESWLHKDIDDNIVQLNNYNIVRQDRGSRGGGVAIYIKKQISYTILSQSCSDFIEQIWLSMTISGKKLVLGNIYRPPNSNSEQFLSYFEDFLINLYTSYDLIFCFGDFNINMNNLDSKLTKTLNIITEVFNLKQLMTVPTRINANSMTLIDLIFYNGDNVLDSGTRDIQVSDHQLIFCDLQFDVQDKAPTYDFEYRPIGNINANNFQTDLANINWQIMYQFINVDDKVHFFTENIVQLFDTHAPIRKVRGRKKPYTPWITDNIRLLIRLRNRALNSFRTTKNPGKWAYYKQLRNYTTSAIRSEKKAYLNFKLQRCNDKQKWQELKNLQVLKSNHKTIPANLRNVNDLNKYFIDSNNNNGPINSEIINFYLNNRLTPNKFSFQVVSENDIMRTISNIKSNATGPDKLNLNLILYCCPYIIPHITHLVNSCILRGEFPLLWKQANILPLPKISHPKDFSDIRSISILPTLSKILEKSLEAQINNFLKENKILPEKQSGFRADHSCATALSEVTNNIFYSLDENKGSVLIMLDYSKAFDTLNHEILLSVLKYIGFTSEATGLIKSFLTNRAQRVCMDGILSDFEDITLGVPQGSILGPLLYSIYTCNLYKCLQYCDYHMYADDTQLLFSFDCSKLQNANICLNTDLNSIFLESQKHMLKINPKKSVAILFANKNIREHVLRNLSPRINNDSIQFKNSVKNLGLILDHKLRFKEHITYKLKIGYSNLKMLYAHRHYLNQSTKKMLCDALVLSHLNFCDVVYGPCLDADDTKRVQKIQNACLRFIFGIRRRERISHKLKDINWLNMENRRELHSVVFFYKILKNETPSYLLNKIRYRTDVHNINIRHRHLINIPQHHKEIFKRSFSYNASFIINKYKISDLTLSCNTFKKKISQKLSNL